VLANVLRERSARYGDGRDAKVYAWEEHVWADAGLNDSPLLSATEAQDYAAYLWTGYAPAYSPYFSGVPEIRVMGDAEAVGGARAQALHHRVLIDQPYLRRTWLAHELMHLLVPAEQHGRTWLAGIILLWESEFNVHRSRTLELALMRGVVVEKEGR
jgi:hypothetical protein